MIWRDSGRLACLIVALTLPAAARAHGEIWTNAGASGPIGGNWRASVDTIVRGDGDDVYEWVASGAIGYQIDDHATLWAGYVHKTAYANDTSAIEQRVREDLVLEDVARIGPVRMGGRLRAEEKWREAVPGLGWRVRPQVRLTLPLREDGPALVAGVEGFFNLGRGAGQKAGYDRIRESAGVQLPLTKRVRLDLGYLRQWTRGAGIADAATFGLAYRW